MDIFILGLTASLIAGLGTGLGALPVLLPIQPSERVQGVLLGIGGGIMLAATSFSLIVPGTEAAMAQGLSAAQAALIMVVGVLLGGRVSLAGPQQLSPRALLQGQRRASGAGVQTSLAVCNRNHPAQFS